MISDHFDENAVGDSVVSSEQLAQSSGQGNHKCSVKLVIEKMSS
jgi:hypothetical protein